MKRSIVLATCLLALAWSVRAESRPARAGVDRPLHTFSIVARDSVTGEIGVAVQSHW